MVNLVFEFFIMAQTSRCICGCLWDECRSCELLNRSCELICFKTLRPCQPDPAVGLINTRSAEAVLQSSWVQSSS